MIGSSLVMAASQDRQQKILMFVLPVIFTPIVITFPAGLVVYWITTNVWTMDDRPAVRDHPRPPDERSHP
jgi:YidC/Oxa1 family membrane protein insertase